MSVENIVRQLDEEISKLTRARAALAGVAGNGRRPRLSMGINGRKRRQMSLAARRKIAAAQRARWAKIKASKRA